MRPAEIRHTGPDLGGPRFADQRPADTVHGPGTAPNTAPGE